MKNLEIEVRKAEIESLKNAYDYALNVSNNLEEASELATRIENLKNEIHNIRMNKIDSIINDSSVVVNNAADAVVIGKTVVNAVVKVVKFVKK